MKKLDENLFENTIRCPICSVRLMDRNSNVLENPKIFVIKESQDADLILKCPRCRKQIGLLLKNEL